MSLFFANVSPENWSSRFYLRASQAEIRERHLKCNYGPYNFVEIKTFLSSWAHMKNYLLIFVEKGKSYQLQVKFLPFLQYVHLKTDLLI